jgi:histone H3/H4
MVRTKQTAKPTAAPVKKIKTAAKKAPAKKVAVKKADAETPSQIRAPVVRRMCLRAGIKRMTIAGVHSVVLEQMDCFVTNIFHAAILRTASRKIMTVSISDVVSAARVRGIVFTPGINPSAKRTPGLTTASFTLPRTEKTATSRRQKSGVVRRRLTRLLQKKDALVIYRGNFAAFARKCVSKLTFRSIDVDVSSLRYSKGVMAVAQLLTEKYIHSLAVAARIIVETSKQQTVNESHFKTAIAIAEAIAPFTAAF